MSWKSGSSLAEEIINILKDNVTDKGVRMDIYRELIPAFENNDCDTLYKCKGVDKAFDKVYDEIYPESDEEDWGDEDAGC